MKNVVVTGVPRAELAVVSELATFGVATAHEVQSRTGYLGPRLRPIQDGARIGGTAVTAICWPGDNLMVHAAVEQCGDGDVLVVTTTSTCTDGMIGELIATSLAARGVRGVVVNAGVRDVAELRAMRFPAWAAAISAQGTVKQTAGAVNVPVSIGGQLIRPGDAIVADDDGVVCVPRTTAAAVLEAARQRATREAGVREELAGGALGLDLHGLRDTLVANGVAWVTAAEYEQ